jgi:FecR protein
MLATVFLGLSPVVREKKGGGNETRPVKAKWILPPLGTIGFDRNFGSPIALSYGVTSLDSRLGWGGPMRALPVMAVALVLVLVLFGAIAGASSPIGLIKVTEGIATVQRGDETLPARLGLAVEEGDILRTGADGRMGVVLRDDTRLSLGPESEIQIDHFVFAPAKGRLGLVVKMARGVMAFVSGNIAKLSHDAVRVETPVAILGVRGTQFLAKVQTP